jgi:hypothetical protein
MLSVRNPPAISPSRRPFFGSATLYGNEDEEEEEEEEEEEGAVFFFFDLSPFSPLSMPFLMSSFAFIFIMTTRRALDISGIYLGGMGCDGGGRGMRSERKADSEKDRHDSRC